MSKSSKSKSVRNWTPDLLPRQDGKLFVITGGNSGIGFDAARMLGERGGRIVIAARSPQKAGKARDDLYAAGVESVDVVELDLASLGSVREAADEIRQRYSHIHGLINNAGIMQTPKTRTVDGHELQLATNHLGHFLWTAKLFDIVEASAGRIVTVASIAHKFGQIDLDDLMTEKKYTPMRAYAQSKLANLMFAMELDKRLQQAGSSVTSIACHPGYSNTNLQSTGPTGPWVFIYGIMNKLLAQPSYKGSYPTLLAAAGDEAQAGGYYGPTGLADMSGPVGDAKRAKQALDQEVWRKLWEATEDLVGQRFPL